MCTGLERLHFPAVFKQSRRLANWEFSNAIRDDTKSWTGVHDRIKREGQEWLNHCIDCIVWNCLKNCHKNYGANSTPESRYISVYGTGDRIWLPGMTQNTVKMKTKLSLVCLCLKFVQKAINMTLSLKATLWCSAILQCLSSITLLGYWIFGFLL